MAVTVGDASLFTVLYLPRQLSWLSLAFSLRLECYGRETKRELTLETEIV